MKLFNYGIAIDFVGDYLLEAPRATEMAHTLAEELGNVSEQAEHSETAFDAMAEATQKIGTEGEKGSTIFGKLTDRLGGLDGILQKIKTTALIVGGVITTSLVAAFATLSHIIISTGQEMEQVFASIKTSLGSEAKTIAELEWGREMATTTPFDLPEVNQALLQMAREGYTKDEYKKNKVFQAIGDMAGSEGFEFSAGMSMFSKAGEGNWEQLAERTGLRASRMENMAMESNRTDEEKTKMIEYAKVVNTATKGTMEYKMALAEYLAIMYKGGMENKLNTFGGALSNVTDLFENFKMEMVGYSQVEGSLFNAMTATIKDKVLKPFSSIVDAQVKMEDGSTKFVGRQEMANQLLQKQIPLTNEALDGRTGLLNIASQMDAQGNLELQRIAEKIKVGESLNAQEKQYAEQMLGYKYEEISLQQKLFTLGKNVGNILTMVWGEIDKVIGKVVVTLGKFITKLSDWFNDFQGNIAPIILWLAIMKIEFKIFFAAFIKAVKPFLTAIRIFWSVIMSWIRTAIDYIKKKVKRLWNLFFKGKSIAEGLGTAIGTIVGAIILIKGIPILVPFIQQLIRAKRYAQEFNSFLRKHVIPTLRKGLKDALVRAAIYLDTLEKKLTSVTQKLINLYESGNKKEKITNQLQKIGKSLGKLTGKLKLAAIAQWLLNYAMEANPVGLIIIGIALLIAYIVLLIVYWDEIREKMQGVSDLVIFMVIAWGLIFAPIVALFVGIPMLLAKYWEEFSVIFTNIWDIIRNVATTVFNVIRFGIDRLKKSIKKMRDYIFSALMRVIKKITRTIKTVVKKITKAIKTVLNKIMNFIKKKFPRLYAILETIGKKINKHLLKPIKSIGKKIGKFLLKPFNKVVRVIKLIIGYLKELSIKGVLQDIGNLLTRVAVKTKEVSDLSGVTMATSREELQTNVTKVLNESTADTYTEGSRLDKLITKFESMTESQQRLVNQNMIENVNIEFSADGRVTKDDFMNMLAEEINEGA